MEEEGSSWPIPHSLWFEKSRVISSFPNCPRPSSKPNCGPQQSQGMLLLPRAVFHNLPQLHFPSFLVIFSYIPEACRDFIFPFDTLSFQPIIQGSSLISLSSPTP